MSERRRLHPATIFETFLRRAPQTVLGLPALAGIGSGRGIAWILGAMLAVGLGSLAFNWLVWLRFTYTIGADELVIERGMLNRTRRSIPLERIQDVSIERTPLARLLGIATVRIETGGGQADEGTLASVGLAEAERLRATLRGVRRAAAASDAAEAPTQEAIYALPLGRLLLSGAFAFSLVWLAAIFGALQFVQQTFDLEWEEIIGWAGVAEREVAQRLSPASIALVLALAVLLGFLSGIVSTLLRDFGFRLTHGEGRFRRTRGLLTRNETVVADRRIQLALVRRGPVAGRLGWQSLDFQTLGGSNDPSGRQQMAPFARAEETDRIVAVAGLPRFERPELRPVAAGHVIRAIIRGALPPLVAIGIGALFFPPLLLALAAVPIPVALALFRRRFHRYALRPDSLQVARGVLAQRDWTVPCDKVQVVRVSETWLQRLLGIASVQVDTAGAKGPGGPHVTDAARDEAIALAKGLIAQA